MGFGVFGLGGFVVVAVAGGEEALGVDVFAGEHVGAVGDFFA